MYICDQSIKTVKTLFALVPRLKLRKFFSVIGNHF